MIIVAEVIVIVIVVIAIVVVVVVVIVFVVVISDRWPESHVACCDNTPQNWPIIVRIPREPDTRYLLIKEYGI